MQINHSENCGKCHSNHWLGVDCKGKLIENWEQDLINSNVAVIDLRKQSGAMIYCGGFEPPNTASNFTKYKSTDQIKTYEDSRKKYEETYMLLNGNESDDHKYSCDFPWSSPNDLRKLGWSVAVHNDYKLNGENYTFWLMTKGNNCLKGEGKTDEEALNQIREQILRGSYE